MSDGSVPLPERKLLPGPGAWIVPLVLLSLLLFAYNFVPDQPGQPVRLRAFTLDTDLSASRIRRSLTKIHHWLYFSAIFCLAYLGLRRRRAAGAWAAVLALSLACELQQAFIAGQRPTTTRWPSSAAQFPPRPPAGLSSSSPYHCPSFRPVVA